MILKINEQRLIPEAETDRSIYTHNGHLDMDQVVERFAQFMHREYRRETSSIVEVEGRLIFLAYLRPLLNGSGNYYVEAQTRGNTRMDIVVAYGNEQFIVELKIWRGEQYEEEGLDQLIGYLKAQGEKKGYLVSFCDLRQKPREGGTFERGGVVIHEVIVAYKDQDAI
jgi:hypothetical protein